MKKSFLFFLILILSWGLETLAEDPPLQFHSEEEELPSLFVGTYASPKTHYGSNFIIEVEFIREYGPNTILAANLTIQVLDENRAVKGEPIHRLLIAKRRAYLPASPREWDANTLYLNGNKINFVLFSGKKRYLAFRDGLLVKEEGLFRLVGTIRDVHTADNANGVSLFLNKKVLLEPPLG